MTVGEKSSELQSDVDFAYGELIEEFEASEQGNEVLRDPKFHEYIKWSSERITRVHTDVISGVINEENVTATQAKEMYHVFPPFCSTSTMVPVMKVSAAGMRKDIESQRKNGDEKTALIRTRRLASAYEELSNLTTGEESELFENKAVALNLELENSNVLSFAESPRKFHAKFSVYDIYFRRLGQRIHDRDGESTFVERHEARRMLASQHQELADVVTELKTVHKTLGEGSQGLVAGFLGEQLVLARTYELIDGMGLLGKIQTSQGYLRQDHTNKETMPNPPRWLLAFDQRIGPVRSQRFTPVEVKKRSFLPESEDSNKSPRSETYKKLLANYLPNISVVTFRLGWNHRDYLNFAETYCRATAKTLAGESVSEREEAVIDIFQSQIDATLMEIIQSHLEDDSEPRTMLNI